MRSSPLDSRDWHKTFEVAMVTRGDLTKEAYRFLMEEKHEHTT
jgi:DnaJ-domain-containing protein 1